jgi:hypothetical protein
VANRRDRRRLAERRRSQAIGRRLSTAYVALAGSSPHAVLAQADLHPELAAHVLGFGQYNV